MLLVRYTKKQHANSIEMPLKLQKYCSRLNGFIENSTGSTVLACCCSSAS